MSFGLVIGFGIPVSIGASIILVHSILLMTDIIGSWAPEGKVGLAISGVLGALYGVGLVLGLQAIVDLFNMLPVNFMPALSSVGSPIVVGFSIFQETVLYFMGIIGISLMGYALAPLFHKMFSRIEKKHEV